ncbi:MAG: hypothetical protein ACLFVX_02490 [Archaeoglobaceae archaeon]
MNQGSRTHFWIMNNNEKHFIDLFADIVKDMFFRKEDGEVDRRKLLPVAGLLLLILGVFSPTAIINDEEYNIYDLNSYVENVLMEDSGDTGLANLLNSIISLVTISILLSIPFGLLSLKFQKTVMITSILAFLAGLFELIFFVLFTQLVEQSGQNQLFLSYSPFIFFVSSAVFLLHNYRTKIKRRTEMIS